MTDGNKVFLRPDEFHRPVEYERSLEKNGLVVLPQQNLALYMYRGGAGPAGPAGPQGPAGADGVDQNSWFDTIIAACSDEESAISTGGPKTTFRAPYPLDLTLGHIRASLTIAPTGATFIVDIHMNGVSLFSTPITIDIGSTTSVGSASPAVLQTTAVPDDAKFEVYVLQVGSTVAGAGLKVAITGIKAA